MNKKQLICMWAGIIIFVLIAMNTETRFDSHGGSFGDSDPDIVDYGPLIIRLVSTVTVTCGLIYTFRNKKDKNIKDD